MASPYSKTFPERAVARLVAEGVLRLDPDASVWRLKKRKGPMLFRCTPKRIDYASSGAYRAVKVTIDGAPVTVQLARLVWQVHKGDIPDRLTVNHKDGNASNNALDNLELATHSEQHKHRFRVLRQVPPVTRLRQRLEALEAAARVALETGDLEPLRVHFAEPRS